MEMKTFCSSMRDEMTAWKAKTYDLIRKAEEMSPGPDQKVKASIDDMEAMIDRIEKTLEKLDRECPVNWDSERAEIEQAMCRWPVNQAIETGVSAPVITLSLMSRFRSRDKDSFSDRVLAALRREFGGHAVVTSEKK